MALRGNLKDFSLPDVFQLVTFSRKTGVLRIVRADEAEGSVWFRDGDVFFASSNWHKEMLGERLVKAQRITPQALDRALQVRSSEPDGGRRLGQILIDEGYISEKVLESFVSDQIQDTIFDLMRWDEGEFDFEAMPDAIDEDIGLSVSIENVVMEGSRRLEEWNRIKKKIPSTDVVFKMATAPGEGTFEISLKPMEWQLLLLVDATRSVAELAVETGRTDFNVARILYGLFSAGLLEFATDEEIAENRAQRAERESKLSEIIAARKAADQAATDAALDREARLSAEAQARLGALGEQPPVAPSAVEAERPSAPAEEPEFLGGGALSPNADDAAVLEQFMGAVLHQPDTAPETPAAEEIPAPPEPEPEPLPAPQPYVPAEEPAFMSAGVTAEAEQPIMVTSVEDLLGIEVAPAESTLSEPEIPAATEPMSLEQEQQPPADFERELMALGLGEPPVDLLEPISQEPVVVPSAEVAPASAADMGLEPVSEPMSAMGEDLVGLVGDLGLPTEIPTAPVPEQVEQPAEADFSELLESLDVDGGATEPAIPAGFDAELLRSDEPAPAGGVISTDAFLDDIGMDDLGFSGGLTDELSALTGADRRQPSRPQANVNAIPDEGTTLRRDARVDKDTVMRIIDGIKNL